MSWDEFSKSWSACTRCTIGTFAFKHVLGSGPQNAILLFLGEGPGRSEDTLGEAFVGPAGHLLRRAILDARGDLEKMYFSNLVACRPSDSQTSPNRAPTDLEISNCRPRLTELVKLLNPQGIVFAGHLARSYSYPAIDLAGWSGNRTLGILHPAFLLRKGGDTSSEYPQYVAKLHQFFDRFKEIRHAHIKNKD